MGLISHSAKVIVFSMCRIVMQAVTAGNEQVIRDVKRIAGGYEKEDWMPKSAQDLCHNTLHTLYMGMASQSSKETRGRAKELSKSIGSYHTDLDIDDIFNAQKNTFTKATGFEPKFKVYGGTQAENLALQVNMIPALPTWTATASQATLPHPMLIFFRTSRQGQGW